MNRRGFTLIEVLVALTLAGLGVVTAVGMVTTSTDALATMARHAEGTDQEANGLTWMSQALLGATVSTDRQSWFVGESDGLRFRSMLPVGFGWSEPAMVEVTAAGGRVTLRGGAVTHTFADSLASSEFDYLGSYGSASPWLSRWESPTAAPLAVRWRRQVAGGRADTTVFFIGRSQ